jgi:4-diphosphocytidyl-2-C-methyl-D-erythritol kinase
MQACSLLARAKINLYLEILGKRSDGYHELAMVLQSIDLADRLHLQLTGSGITLRCDHPEVPLDSTNLAYRAAELLQEECHCSGGVAILIQKRIPVAAGLAGGSTDAAAVLVGLNQLWGLGLTTADLQELAARLGSDVPFCINGGTQLATGRGEVLEPLEDLQQLPILLAKPRSVSISTAWAYRSFQLAETNRSKVPGIHAMLASLSQAAPVAIARCLYNDLEIPVLAHHPEILALKQHLQNHGALGTLLSGSGSSVFAIMPSLQAAEIARDQLAGIHANCDFWAIRTAPTGISLQPRQGNA